MCASIDRRAACRAVRGLSLIELMVAVVVSLLVALAAAQGAHVFLASQRQGVGAAGGGVNATTALAAIKADAASGGLGFFGDRRFTCSLMNFGVGLTKLVDGAAFAPFRAQQTAGNEALDIVYASDVSGGAAVRLSAASDGTTASLASLLPAAVGQTVLLSPAAAGTPCLIRKVTAVTPSTPTTRQVLAFGNTDDYNQTAFTTPPAFAATGLATLIGTLQWHRYALSGTDLTLTRVITGESITLLRNVIGFRVDYGVSDASPTSTTLESWEEPVGAWATLDATNIRRVRALRIGVVVRSPQREKVNEVTGVCEASAAKPTLFDGKYTIEPDVTDWQCYRYRSATVVVPMRNVIYGT